MSITREKRYIEELAQAAMSLYNGGTHSPNADEIALAHFQDRLFGGAAVEDVRKKLIKIRDILALDYEQPVTLVSRVYYTKFRRSAPVSLADARTCLPLGWGKKAEGIHFQTGPDDLIWQAAKEQNLLSAAGKWGRAADSVVLAYGSGRIDSSTARAMLAEGGRKAQVNRPDLIAELAENANTPELESGTAG